MNDHVAVRGKGIHIVAEGGDGQVGSDDGRIYAVRADTGELIWRFYIVPGDPAEPFESVALEEAASTWTGTCDTLTLQSRNISPVRRISPSIT